MITLLIIADDFTGALDTGVQFAAAGAGVRVVTDIRYDYRKSQPGVRVLVMDAETRHLDGRAAYYTCVSPDGEKHKGRCSLYKQYPGKGQRIWAGSL